MPHQGELFVPTYSKAEAKIYFGLVTRPRTNSRSAIAWCASRCVPPANTRLGCARSVTTGRSATFTQPATNTRLSCAISSSIRLANMPTCLDRPEDRGYSTQACSVNSRWGKFSEMEYHVPAIGGDTGLNHIEDRSQLWAFRGSRDDIVKIARALLSNEIE